MLDHRPRGGQVATRELETWRAAVLTLAAAQTCTTPGARKRPGTASPAAAAGDGRKPIAVAP
eukprot:14352515-Alexandrium_andersonii.AAC.1